MVLLKVVAFNATVHIEDTTLSHVIWAINRTKVYFHCMACKMAKEVMLSCRLEAGGCQCSLLGHYVIFQYYGGGGVPPQNINTPNSYLFEHHHGFLHLVSPWPCTH